MIEESASVMGKEEESLRTVAKIDARRAPMRGWGWRAVARGKCLRGRKAVENTGDVERMMRVRGMEWWDRTENGTREIGLREGW